jgi:hypothetical protein
MQLFFLIKEKTKDVKLYLTGKTKNSINCDNTYYDRPSYQMKLAAHQVMNVRITEFIGYIDELIICYKPLSSKMIKQEFRKMNVKQN